MKFNDYSISSDHNRVLKRTLFCEKDINNVKKYLIEAIKEPNKAVVIPEIPNLTIKSKQVDKSVLNIDFCLGQNKLVEMAAIAHNRDKKHFPYIINTPTSPVCVSEWNAFCAIQTPYKLFHAVNRFRAELCFAFFDIRLA
ncbi:hypothetical protein [Photobacterium leiognathi]|uniref:hypothetical protein n=1 Tax=Photobacterium leiognathi TaxID=553611 RepID=UPI0029827F34|nr:hypothetical protein [Photobacterium leiognathi]